MGAAEIAKWLGEHTSAVASSVTSVGPYLWYACSFVAVCFILLLFRHRFGLRPGQVFTVLAIEASILTIFPAPGTYERAAALAAAGLLCLTEILVVQESGKRVERESQQKHSEIIEWFKSIYKLAADQLRIEQELFRTHKGTLKERLLTLSSEILGFVRERQVGAPSVFPEDLNRFAGLQRSLRMADAMSKSHDYDRQTPSLYEERFAGRVKRIRDELAAIGRTNPWVEKYYEDPSVDLGSRNNRGMVTLAEGLEQLAMDLDE